MTDIAFNKIYKMENQENAAGQQTINIQLPSANNIASRRSIIPSLFAMAIIFFFFNFFTVKCGGDKVQSIRGIDLVVGFESKAPTNSSMDNLFTPKASESKVPTSPWAIIALGAAIIGLGAYLIKEKREAHIGVIAGVTGVGSLLILQTVVKDTIEKKADGALASVELEFAFWAACIAMGIAAYISYLRIKKGNIVAVNAMKQTTKDETVNPQQAETTSKSQENSFDIFESIKKNKAIVISPIGVIIIGLGVYYFFIRHDPTRDGKRVATAQWNCYKNYVFEKNNIVNEFIDKFESYKFTNRQKAKAMLDTLMLPTERQYKRNSEKTIARYEELKKRFAVDNDQTYKFEYAFNAQNEICRYDSNYNVASILDNALEKIKTIEGLTEKLDKILKRKFGRKYSVLTDEISRPDEYDMSIIRVEREKDEYYPYILEGDLNGDRVKDYAALVKNNHETRYRESHIAIIWGNDNSIEISDEACSAISLFKGDRTLQSPQLDGEEKVDSVILKTDAIQVECFGKSSWVLYWDGASFKKIWTGF